MPSPTTITVNDSSATAISFTPKGMDSQNVYHWRKAGSVPIGDENLSISLKETPTKYKARFLLSRPTMVTETINGVDKYDVRRIAFGDVTFTFDKMSTGTERDDTLNLLANILLDAVAEGVVKDLEGWL